MQTYRAAIALLLWASVPAYADTPWGADYFPNVPLVTHEGETVRFFDDLIEGKVVAINFIYTTCPDSCPLETARMAKVQELLGDRVGQDIFMYSITIDPEHDTPEVLAKYAKRYDTGPGWWFLTGEESDITLLRQKLGLYIEEIQDGSNNHNLSLIIGNQATGKWLKRSPFENPFILAKEIGTWLTGWKAPPEERLDYADAPEVRQISQGEYLFRTRCSTCHTIGHGQDGLAPGLEGPDLLDVTKRRDRKWLERWIAVPDEMLEEGDPIALGLYAKYNEVPMPNMRLSETDVGDLLAYLGSESNRVRMQQARERRAQSRSIALASSAGSGTSVGHSGHSQNGHAHGGHSQNADSRNGQAHTVQAHTAHVHNGPAPNAGARGGDAVAIMNAWVRQAHPEAEVNAGYMTLVNVGSEDVTLVEIQSPMFDQVEFHEMSRVDGLMRMRGLPEVVVPAGGQARFEPGGRHLMLKGPRRHLTDGQSVELTLRFSSGREQRVSVTVADR